MDKVFFSPGTDCLNAITDGLLSARNEVRICVFTISDNRIVDAIKELQSQNVDIKIITDNKKCFDRGSDIHYLAGRGIEIRTDVTDAHMHHKFAVIDDKLTLTGSYNWTKSAEERNYENVLLTDNGDIIKSYTEEFDRMWNSFKPFSELQQSHD